MRSPCICMSADPRSSKHYKSCRFEIKSTQPGSQIYVDIDHCLLAIFCGTRCVHELKNSHAISFFFSFLVTSFFFMIGTHFCRKSQKLSKLQGKTCRTLFNTTKQNCMRQLERFWQSSLLSNEYLTQFFHQTLQLGHPRENNFWLLIFCKTVLKVNDKFFQAQVTSV